MTVLILTELHWKSGNGMLLSHHWNKARQLTDTLFLHVFHNEERCIVHAVANFVFHEYLSAWPVLYFHLLWFNMLKAWSRSLHFLVDSKPVLVRLGETHTSKCRPQRETALAVGKWYKSLVLRVPKGDVPVQMSPVRICIMSLSIGPVSRMSLKSKKIQCRYP